MGKLKTTTMKRNWILTASFILSVIGVALMIIYACITSFNDWSWIIKPELASQYGSFISGIVGSLFTLVGFLLIYETIRRQRINFEKQQFESKFFEMVRYHRENVDLMNYKTSYSKEEKIVTGRQVFVELKKQCVDIVIEIKQIIKKNDTWTDIEYNKRILEIAFLIIYFGVGKRTKETLESILIKYIPEQKDLLISELRKKKTKYNDKIVFYGGHQSKLGNYFRHLYHTVKFVDKTDFLSENEKESYIKILRAQLTNYEQAILFYNSMCSLGKNWQNEGYIMRYSIIKNLPPNFLNGIDFSVFYKLDYEYEEL